MRSVLSRIFVLKCGSGRHWVTKFTQELPALFGFAKWQSLSAVSGMMANQSNPVLLGFISSPSGLAHFNVAARLEQAISAIFIKLSDVLLPHFGSMKDEADEKLSRHFLISAFVMSCLGSLLMGPMIIWAEPVMSLWVGEEFGALGGFQLRVLATGGLINMAGAVFTMFAIGTGRVELVSRVVLEYALVTVTLSGAVILWLGATYAGVGLVLGGIFSVGRRWQVSCKFISGHSRRASAMITLLPVTVAIVLSYMLLLLDPPMALSWFGLLWRYGATSFTIFGSIVLIFSCTYEGRKVQSQVLSVCWASITKNK